MKNAATAPAGGAFLPYCPIPSLLTSSIPKLRHQVRCIIGGSVSIMRARYFPLVIAFAVASTLQTAAQTLPWPNDPAPKQTLPWPDDPAPTGAVGSRAAMTPAPVGAAPPQGAFGGSGGGPPPCVVEFGKLRDEVQKKGMAAKTAQERKVTREEMCKIVSVYSAAERKWLKFAEAGVSSCGIPGEVVNQLKQVHARTEQAKTNICAAGLAAAGPSTPSLSDALGTTRLPLDTKKTGSNYLDTLTGNVIQR
jgi:hypothetical protein